jgi:putative ABC transport system permease protein
MRLLRNLARRKLRSTLTISGILIGIMALVVFGSMADKIDSLVKGGSDYYRDKVVVSAKGATLGLGGVLSMADAATIGRLDGVAVAAPAVMMPLSEDQSGASMGVPPMIAGGVAGADQGRETFHLDYANGRALTTADEGRNVVVLGSDLARQNSATVGGSITLRGVSFEIVGILAPTLTAPDNEAMVPLAAAQQLLMKTLPPLISAKLDPADIATNVTVYPKSGVDTSTIAAAITAALPSVGAMTGKDFDRQIGSTTSLFNAILVGIGLISLIVGGLSVVNTTAMSVAERTREIGIKRALGASRWRIRREIVTESAVIGLIGGLLGLAVGALIALGANEAGRASGTILFQLTVGTATSAVVFATVLGAIAGFVPAWNASRMDPVAALRYE